MALITELERAADAQFLKGGDFQYQQIVSRASFLKLLQELREERKFYRLEDTETSAPKLVFGHITVTVNR